MTSNTLTAGGRQRQYLLYVPPSAPAGPLPLVVMLHGGTGTSTSAAKNFGWTTEADSNGFAVAFPNGLSKSWSVGGGCCGPPAREQVNDVAFVEQVVADAESKATIDTHRVYATGISEGGMLTYRLACDSTVFAAVAPDAGTLLGDCPSAAPISVIDVHGTDDPRIRYDGNEGAGVNRIDGPPIPDLASQWRTTSQCQQPAVTRSGSLITSTAACADGRTVEYIAVVGGGHDWPGALCGRNCSAAPLDATDTFWQFFAAHPKP